jgi:hypothetical protein
MHKVILVQKPEQIPDPVGPTTEQSQNSRRQACQLNVQKWNSWNFTSRVVDTQRWALFDAESRHTPG